jgi:hypothetical protein
MGGFFDLGGHSVHLNSWTTSRSGSSSRGTSRRNDRRRQDRSRDTDLFDDLNRQFDNMSASFDHHFADDSFFDSGFDAFRSHDRDTIGTSRSRGRSAASSYESEASRPAAYSGFSDMPAGSRYDAGPDFTEPFFLGMHGDDRTAGTRYQAGSPRYVEAEQERPFFMRRADTASSSRGRSDSSQFYPKNLRRADTMPSARNRSDSSRFDHDSRGYQATERMQESAQTPRRRRSPSPLPSYARDTSYSSASTARPAPRAASPPRRRHRSPSPVKRSNTRRRSPSPPPTRKERSDRTGEGKRFRPEVRRPEASSKTSGSTYGESSRSRAAPEPASRNQYNGPYPSGPSRNQCNGPAPEAKRERPSLPKPEPKRERAPPPKQPKQERAPPPKPTSWSRSKPSGSSSSRSQSHAHSESSRSRSGSSSSSTFTARPAPAPHSRSALKKLFDAYNAKWESLSRTDKAYPLPTSQRDLYSLAFHGGAPSLIGAYTNEQIFIVNVQLLFLAGFGLSGTVKRFSDGIEVKIDNRELNGENLRLLGKWLSRKEQPRWHPDRMNLRTGVEGRLDEEISKRREVVAMRTAGQGLLAVIDK